MAIGLFSRTRLRLKHTSNLAPNGAMRSFFYSLLKFYIVLFIMYNSKIIAHYALFFENYFGQ